MSNLSSKISLKNGEQVLIRRLTAQDAGAMHAYAGALFQVTDTVISTPEEYKKRTVEDTRKRMDPVDGSFWVGFGAFLPKSPDQLIGSIDMMALSREKLKHVGTIGMGILTPYQGIGLGTALFRHLLKNADLYPQIERLELEVLSRNHAGLALYKKMGFVIEGTRRNAFRQLDGRMEDSVVMALLREDLWQALKNIG